jgi:hypothetical protein
VVTVATNPFLVGRMARLLLNSTAQNSPDARQENTSIVDLLFHRSESPYGLDMEPPSKAAQMSYFTGDIDKAVWVAFNTTDSDVLTRFSKHRSVQVRRAVAGNPHTPSEAREYLRSWSVKQGDTEALNQILGSEPLLPLMQRMAQWDETANAFEFYSMMRSAGMNVALVAGRLRNEGDEQLARLALASPDPNWRASAVHLAFHGKAGSLGLTEAVHTAETWSQDFPSPIHPNVSSPIDFELRQLVDNSPELTGELLWLASPRVGDVRRQMTNPVQGVDDRAVEMIMQAAQDRSAGDRPRPGQQPNGLSSSFGWDALASAGARFATMGNLTLEQRQAAFLVGGLSAALQLVTCQEKLEAHEIDNIIDESTGLTLFRNDVQVRVQAEAVHKELLKRHKLTPAQQVRALVASPESLREFAVGEQLGWANSLDDAFIDELAQSPEALPGALMAGASVTREYLARTLLSSAFSGVYAEDEQGKTVEFLAKTSDGVVDGLLSAISVQAVIAAMGTLSQTSELINAINARIQARLGVHQDRWDMMFSLLSGWEGTLPDLLESTLACCGVSSHEPAGPVSEFTSGVPIQLALA